MSSILILALLCLLLLGLAAFVLVFVVFLEVVAWLIALSIAAVPGLLVYWLLVAEGVTPKYANIAGALTAVFVFYKILEFAFGKFFLRKRLKAMLQRREPWRHHPPVGTQDYIDWANDEGKFSSQSFTSKDE